MRSRLNRPVAKGRQTAGRDETHGRTKGIGDVSNGEEWQSGGDTSHAPHTARSPSHRQVRKHTAGRWTHRLRLAAVLLSVALVVALAASLTAFFTSIAASFLGQGAISTPTIRAVSAATGKATQTPASADWYTLRSWDGGFQIDVPGVLGSSHGYFIDDFSGMGADLSYTGAPLSSPLQRREALLEVSILYATKITDRNLCPQGGVAVILGSGSERAHGWVRDEGRIVALNLVLNGKAIQVTLDSQNGAQPVLAYYGDIWRHMLASFAPLPGVQRLTTHPCG